MSEDLNAVPVAAVNVTLSRLPSDEELPRTPANLLAAIESLCGEYFELNGGDKAFYITMAEVIRSSVD